MASIRHRNSRTNDEEESYFISMADMMVGLVFIFIILLIYFALQFQQKSKQISDASETRQEMLADIVKEIKHRDATMQISIVAKSGVLRLPAQILFLKGEEKLTDAGMRAVGTVAQALAQVLPCYTYPRRLENCRPVVHGVDAIFIEGHTDGDPLNGRGPISTNLELSALRATNTFHAMNDRVVSLGAMLNRDRQPVLSVSGYGDSRLIDRGPGEDAKSRNRRIDLRFLMEAPEDKDLSSMLVGSK